MSSNIIISEIQNNNRNEFSSNIINSKISSRNITFRNHSRITDLQKFPTELSENIRATEYKETEDLTSSFRILLVIGRLIGVLPFTGCWNGKTEDLKFKLCSFGGITSILIIIPLFINVLVGISGFHKSSHENAKELAFNCHMVMFYGTGLFIYVYMLLHTKRFLNVLKIWKAAKYFYPLQDYTLRRDVILITLIVYTSIILENATWHVKHFTTTDETGFADFAVDTTNITKANLSLLEAFYKTSEPDWSRQISYHPCIAIFILITNKWALYSWNYIEILIIVSSRALCFKFKHLQKCASDDLDFYNNKNKQINWGNIVADHSKLCEILLTFDQFLSPLIFMSFWNNIYNICIHITLSLSTTEGTTLIAKIYSTWSFFHLITRFFMVTFSAGNVNTYANAIHNLFRNCPADLYKAEIKKYEKQLCYYYGSNNTGIGLTGLGYFTVSKPIILKTLNVIFTVEIVLLQNAKK